VFKALHGWLKKGREKKMIFKLSGEKKIKVKIDKKKITFLLVVFNIK